MNLAVFGANGRVGQRVCQLAEPHHNVLKIEKGTNTADFCADVCIDFSLPQATQEVCQFCKRCHCPLVTGVTGRNAVQQQQIDELQQIVPVVAKSNFSTGIQLVEEICQMLAPLGWDCEIVEIHRKDKADSPSGTAKQLSITLLKNGTRTVTVHALRCGSNFGCHQVVFATQGESITVTHQAENVDIFARGALRIATELARKN